jgi:hypothetical protein
MKYYFLESMYVRERKKSPGIFDFVSLFRRTLIFQSFRSYEILNSLCLVSVMEVRAVLGV